MLEFLVSYWWVILIIVALLVVVGFFIYAFVKKPTSEQIAQIKEWLLFAVAKAEQELGSGTGQLKLRYVYDMFLSRFTFLAPLISFETFSFLVDEVLDQFRELLDTNNAVVELIEKKDDKNEQ